MEHRQLRYFCVVAGEANLTRAAKRLQMSSPALSQQIKALERELGAALFQRTPAGMVLTGAGNALLPEARVVLAAAERAVQVTRAAAAERRTLRVAMPPGTPAELVMRLRTAVRAAGCDVIFEVTATSEQVDRLRRQDLDLGLVTLPAEIGALQAVLVHDEPLGILLSAAHPLAALSQMWWADLTGQELLWFRRELAPGYHDMLLAACDAGGWQPQVRVTDVRRAIVSAELGSGEPVVALQPAHAASGEPALTWRPLAAEAPRFQLALAWSPETVDGLSITDHLRC